MSPAIHPYNILTVIRTRADQASFHLESLQHVRIEFRNLRNADTLGPFAYDGDLVVTCYRGSIQLTAATQTETLNEMDQAVIPAGTTVSILCETAGTIQIIWSPAHAATTQKFRA